MSTEQIEELGKKEIGYDKLKIILGEAPADAHLWSWTEGFIKCKEILNRKN